MDLLNLLKNIEYKLLQGENAEITGISMDTREIQPGDLFVCIKGFNHDSHDYIKDAVKKGAAAIIAEKPCTADGIPVVLVESSRKALAYIAVNFYNDPAASFNLIGVTGTNGKTSVTYMIEAILKEAGRLPGVIGTLKARAGFDINVPFKTSTTPDTPELIKILSKMRDLNATDVCMEVSSHALALYKVDGLKFKIGIFTNLTQDHLDFHHTMENYFNAKKRLFTLCETGVINLDDKASQRIIEESPCKILTYGMGVNCGIRAFNIAYDTNGISFDTIINEETIRFKIPMPVKFAVSNALAAIAAAVLLNIPLEKIRLGLSNLNIPGRFQSIPNTKGFEVVVDYAHSPDALENILKSARDFTKGNIITVFGCGGDRDKAKRKIMGEIAGNFSDLCIITSDNPRSEDPMEIIYEIEKGVKNTNCEYKKFEDRKTAIYEAVNRAKSGDMVIIAGKGHEDYQELKNGKIHFDDAETARQALSG